MLYEWRTYAAMPNKLPALRTHLEAAINVGKKHGLGVLRCWIEAIGTSGQVMSR